LDDMFNIEHTLYLLRIMLKPHGDPVWATLAVLRPPTVRGSSVKRRYPSPSRRPMCPIQEVMERLKALHRDLKAGQKSLGHNRHWGALSLYARCAQADRGVVDKRLNVLSTPGHSLGATLAVHTPYATHTSMIVPEERLVQCVDATTVVRDPRYNTMGG